MSDQNASNAGRKMRSPEGHLATTHHRLRASGGPGEFPTPHALARPIRLSVTLVVCLFGTLLGASDASGQVAQVVAYEGHLEHDGTPVNGHYGMRFRLFDSADAGDQVFEEEWSDGADRSCSAADCRVPIYRGSFRVLIGSHAPLSSALSVNAPLHVEVDVRDNAGVWQPLSSRQPLLALPYALWSLGADEIEVGGDLVVEGEMIGAEIAATERTNAVSADLGDLSSTSMTVRGEAVVGGDFTATSGALAVSGDLAATNEIRTGAAAPGDVAFVVADGGELTINPGGGHSRTVLQPGLAVGGVVTAELPLDVRGTMRFGDGDDGASASTARPLFAVRFLNMGTGTGPVNTGMGTGNWFCWIGGHRFANGDYHTGNSSSVLHRVYAYESGSRWHVRADARSHNDEHETHEVTVICAQRGLVEEGHTEWFE